MLSVQAYQVPALVSRDLKLVSSPSFFLEIAAKSDAALTEAARDKLSALAAMVMASLETIVNKTEEKVDKSSEALQAILKAAAEDDGEFLVPLSLAKSAALRGAMLERSGQLDEPFLATVNAYVRKSEETGLTGMVPILQAVLQQYASITLMEDKSITMATEGATTPRLLDKLLATPPAAWEAVVAYELGRVGSVLAKDDLNAEIQGRVESVVLALPAGSYGQVILAEFLRELTKVINKKGSVVVE
jgi:hypothetical protein